VRQGFLEKEVATFGQNAKINTADSNFSNEFADSTD